MTVQSAVQTYLKTYSGLKANAPVWTTYLGPRPTEYSVTTLGGDRILEHYLDGATLRVFNFAFRSVESTADELTRVQTDAFIEAFSDWLETQSEAGVLPILGAKKTALSIKATGWGFLFEQGDSNTGVYQVQCELVYEQRP